MGLHQPQAAALVLDKKLYSENKIRTLQPNLLVIRDQNCHLALMETHYVSSLRLIKTNLSPHFFAKLSTRRRILFVLRQLMKNNDWTNYYEQNILIGRKWVKRLPQIFPR